MSIIAVSFILLLVVTVFVLGSFFGLPLLILLFGGGIAFLVVR